MAAPSILDLINEAEAKSWRRLAIITPDDISEFPEELLRLVNLSELSISNIHHHVHGSELHTIGSISHFTPDQKTKSFYHEVGRFSLAEVLPCLARLQELESLQIVVWGSGGRMTLRSVPQGIAKLRKLNSLALSWTSLAQFPLEVANLPVLAALELQYNKIALLPREIEKLKNLRALNLSNNALTEVPSELGQLTELRELRLGNEPGDQRDAGTANRITALPLDIRRLTSLRTLDLRGNPLVSVPPEILERVDDPRVILSYYFDRLKKPLHEVKLLIVGQGAVGKTSLVRRLIHGEFNPGETKTDGIAISQWQVEGEESQKPIRKSRSKSADSQAGDNESNTPLIRLNTWDFGGQEIMHATHQFFLTKRSLYLLVLDSRLTQEENRVEYWLKIIQSFGGDSPVLIVGNKIDQHPLDIDRTGLRKKYPNIVGVFETSAATGAGIPELRTAIAEQVRNLPHVRDLLPEAWFAVKTRLENLGRGKNYISHDEYLSLCAENGVEDDSGQNTLIGFLHDLGVILHFQEDPRLEALGILNPQWVTNGVYKILNSHQLFQQRGTLTLSMLHSILDMPEYPRDKRLFIVDMMRKFELCYDIEANQLFLVPDLLPKDEPYTGEWTGALAFQYHYNVLPNSIISRFIVRMNAFIHKTIWRSGVVLKSGGNTALVKGDIEDRKIKIWVDGDEPTRRDFLSAIRSQFDSIHMTIVKIEAREKVPVPDHPGVVVDYEHLLKLERKGVAEFIPEGLDDSISVRELLDGIATQDDRQRSLMNPRRVEHEAISPLEKLPSNTDTAEEKSLPVRTLKGIFVGLPRILGRAVLDLFGRDKAADSTSVLLGYAALSIGVLLLWGFIDLNTLLGIFKDIWRFFFPGKGP